MQVDIKAMPGEKAFIVDCDVFKILEKSVERISIEKRTDKKNDIFYKFFNYDKRIPQELVYKTDIDAEKALNLYLLQKVTFNGEKLIDVLPSGIL